MALKDLLVYVDQTKDSLIRLRLAADLALRHGPAARSLNDALPLIERAERTTIVMINPSDFIHRREGPPGEHVLENLRRHGVRGEVVKIENVSHASIADSLQSEAHALDADLIVAGAFGHPRLWKKMLVGVTRDLLAHIKLPIFMSH